VAGWWGVYLATQHNIPLQHYTKLLEGRARVRSCHQLTEEFCEVQCSVIVGECLCQGHTEGGIKGFRPQWLGAHPLGYSSCASRMTGESAPGPDGSNQAQDDDNCWVV
jgi:hypothetical protein